MTIVLVYGFAAGVLGGFVGLCVFEGVQAFLIRRRIAREQRQQPFAEDRHYRHYSVPASNLTDEHWAKLMGCEIDTEGRLHVVKTRVFPSWAKPQQFDGQGSVDE